MKERIFNEIRAFVKANIIIKDVAVQHEDGDIEAYPEEFVLV
jgi:hypothetical protein